MRILVVGGAGYIGSATAAHLLAAGHEVAVYDNLSHGYREAVPGGAAFIQGDVSHRATLDRAFDAVRPEAVLHFAAYIEAGESMQKPGKYFSNNVGGAISLLDAMTRHDVDRIVFSSTAGVYAGQAEPLAEDAPIGPANVYAETKLMVERMLGWYARVEGLRACALRYFNACGAMLDADGQPVRGEAHQPETHLIPIILQVALGQREGLSLFGTDYPTRDGTCIRDYVHIEDLASAHLLALDALDAPGLRVYNLGNGRGYTNREVVETARAVTGHPIPVADAPRRPGDAAALVASAEKIRRELGWQPRTPELKDIIATAWAWHRTHPYGYQQVEPQP